MISKIIIEPRYAETDQMGVIHHAVYPVWYEMGRVKLCEDIGLTFAQIEAKGIRNAMIDLHVTYHKPCVFGKKYTLATTVIDVTRIKLLFSHALYDEEQNLVNSGTTMLVWVDAELRPINVEKKHQDVYALFLNVLNKKD